MRGRLVDEEAVRPLAMFAEAFAVVAHHHDDGLLCEAAIVEEREESADLRVDERNFAEIRAPLVARLERFGRTVRRARVVKMDPAEEALGRDAIEPRERLVRHLVARAI